MRNIGLQSPEPSVDAAQLAGQLEDLLHQVWECERWWSLENRIDLAASIADAGGAE
jgi:hypothetical protein